MIIGLLLVVSLGYAAEWEIDNPYEQVDWAAHQQYKANLHTHTTMSDGTGTPLEIIHQYADLGYNILSLTDHDTLGPGIDRNYPDRSKATWPWPIDPEMINMIAIEGNEISRVHHIGSYFNDYGDAEVLSEEEAVEQIGKRDGLAVLFHPGRYRKTIDWYVTMYQTFPHLIGIEIYNQGDRYPQDRETWDAILTKMIAERVIWGFSNDDMHYPDSQLGRNWTVMVLPELTLDTVRAGMENGWFFYVYAPEGHDAPPPTIKSITVDSAQGMIAIHATEHQHIDWISEGNIVHQGEQVNLTEIANLGQYLRAVVHASEGEAIIGTQPFRIRSLSE